MSSSTQAVVKAAPVNHDRIIEGLHGALQAKTLAAQLGQELAQQVDRIYFIGCGAPNRVMLTLEYWMDHAHTSFQVKRYFPAEFMTLEPHLDERTLVILGSKSGTTQETVEAARYLQNKPCLTVAVTSTEHAPLAQAAQRTLLMGDTEQAHTGMFIVLQALVGGLMHARDGWPHLQNLLTSLDALPEVLVESAQLNDERGRQDADTYQHDKVLYHIASGPVFATAYVFGVCMLMEMQWMHSIPIEAAEWFHGPFEILDATTPVMLLLGEDPSRPLMERAVTFCRKYTDRLMIYDARDYPMTGIHPDIRPIVAPFVLQAALNRFAEHLSERHNHHLDTRRYMWVTEY
ncbi:SIS domain-containing protein [Deinococcus maricopensis]|uniref:Sugar isomerase (SIS) n=1 Tax=Deinococcus maricopensis (strain DSM 21211 / LMG 22137 / NRRL B-23946 / LB-34) TaxID=709986 RepID=E8U304_DEIML|nr:SIS domain-containing protein [Deinococcus maricopensis]ADV65742.1 sugar isomerase (SIS) [Deinococcus maricopensis DSM 21211]